MVSFAKLDANTYAATWESGSATIHHYRGGWGINQRGVRVHTASTLKAAKAYIVNRLV